MKKLLRLEMYGRTEVVELPGDSPIGPLYGAHGRKVGEIVSQMEASDLPELGSIGRSSFECALRALIKHGSMIEAIRLLRQLENGNGIQEWNADRGAVHRAVHKDSWRCFSRSVALVVRAGGRRW